MSGAVGYFRVSTTEQANTNYSLTTQEAKFKHFCTSNTLPVVKVFIDKHSARTDARPEFQQMLRFLKENRRKVSHLIVSDLSRLARNVVDQGQTVVLLGELGIKLVSIDEPNLDESAAGKLLQNVLGSMSQWFSDSLSEKTKSRMEAGVKQGRWLWVAPVGYTNANKQIIVDTERAPLVVKAFELVASGNFATIDAVRRQITALGLQTRKGRALTKQTFARMLNNPFYCGWIVSGGNKYRGTHTPLISEELFESVQTRLNAKSTPHVRSNEDFPLRGFIKCTCGGALTAGWSKGKMGKHYARYWCWAKGCAGTGIAREELELHWIDLLGMMEPTTRILEQLPDIARREWSTRKAGGC